MWFYISGDSCCVTQRHHHNNQEIKVNNKTTRTHTHTRHTCSHPAEHTNTSSIQWPSMKHIDRANTGAYVDTRAVQTFTRLLHTRSPPSPGRGHLFRMHASMYDVVRADRQQKKKKKNQSHPQRRVIDRIVCAVGRWMYSPERWFIVTHRLSGASGSESWWTTPALDQRLGSDATLYAYT